MSKNLKYLLICMSLSGLLSACGSGSNSSPNNSDTADSANNLGTNIVASLGSQQQHYVYVTNSGSNSISMYQINPSSGELLPLAGTPTVASGNEPTAIALSPTKQYAYVANYNSNTLSMYKVNPANGRLTPLPEPTIATGQEPSSISFDASGQFVYVTNYGDNSISMYSLDPNSGSLSPLNTPGIASGQGPSQLKLAPNGQYAYVCNYNDNSVSTYNIAADGTLSVKSTVAAGNAPIAINFDNNNHAYITDNGGKDTSTIIEYSIGNDGSLVQLAVAPTGSTPMGLTFDQSGKYAFSPSNSNTGGILTYTVDTSNGNLLPQTHGITASGGAPTVIKFSPDGNYAYVPNYLDNSISMYSFNQANGKLTPLSSTPAINSGSHPNSLVVD